MAPLTTPASTPRSRSIPPSARSNCSSSLLRINGNAAPAEGDTASPHLTGQAVDIAKHGLSLAEIAWMRGYLLPLNQQGKIDVEEEFQQACFHISVYKKYLPPAAAPNGSWRITVAAKPTRWQPPFAEEAAEKTSLLFAGRFQMTRRAFISGAMFSCLEGGSIG